MSDYDPSAAVVEFQKKLKSTAVRTDKDERTMEVPQWSVARVEWLRKALLAAHAAGIEEAAKWLDDWGSRTMAKTYARELRDAARADGAELG